VTCDELKPWLHVYADGELDLARNLEVEAHLQECPVCAAALRQLQALKHSLGDAALYHRPADYYALRQRILAPLRAKHGPRRGWANTAAALLAGVASLALFILMSWGILVGFERLMDRLRTGPSAEDLLAQEAVSDHLRSLLAGADPRVDVASSDRHEVKPWFNGRVPFSPVVRDLDVQDYRLIGGRLDYLDNRKVAVLVYKHRKHPISLFTWPTAGAADEAPHGQSRQGFQLVRWTQDGMTYWAVSDLNEEELLRFAELIRHGP
jgi:anti-sigma factor RsiW